MNLVKTIFTILFAFPCLVKPQQIINQKQNGQPVEIYAEEGIEWHKNDNKYLAIGNAIAKAEQCLLNQIELKLSTKIRIIQVWI